MKKISIEEHFATEAYIDYLRSRRDVPKREFIEDDKGRTIEVEWWAPSNFMVIDPNLTSRLCDLGEGRLRDMDEIACQPYIENLDNLGSNIYGHRKHLLLPPIDSQRNALLYEYSSGHPVRRVAKELC
jgi:hypothetical protein